MRIKIFILISTINDRILNLENILHYSQENIIYIVNHQISENLSDEINIFIEKLTQRKDVNYSNLVGNGVVKNRNNIIKKFIQVKVSIH